MLGAKHVSNPESVINKGLTFISFMIGVPGRPGTPQNKKKSKKEIAQEKKEEKARLKEEKKESLQRAQDEKRAELERAKDEKRINLERAKEEKLAKKTSRKKKGKAATKKEAPQFVERIIKRKDKEPLGMGFESHESIKIITKCIEGKAAFNAGLR